MQHILLHITGKQSRAIKLVYSYHGNNNENTGYIVGTYYSVYVTQSICNFEVTMKYVPLYTVDN